MSAGWFRSTRKITRAKAKMATASSRKAVAMDRFSTREVVTGGRMIVARPLPEAQMLRARARWRKNHRLMRMDTGIMDPRP